MFARAHSAGRTRIARPLITRAPVSVGPITRAIRTI